MKKVLFASLIMFVVSCGGTEVVYVKETVPADEVESTTTASPKTTVPAATRPPSNVPDYSGGYDPELYDDFLWESVNEFWWLFSEDQLLQMGLLVCEEFDRGSTMDEVTRALTQIVQNTSPAFMDGLAAVTAGALVFLCPEHQHWLDTI